MDIFYFIIIIQKYTEILAKMLLRNKTIYVNTNKYNKKILYLTNWSTYFWNGFLNVFIIFLVWTKLNVALIVFVCCSYPFEDDNIIRRKR